MCEIRKAPPSSYYEQPYLPGAGDREVYETIPLLPVEANSLLVESAGRPLSTLDRLALERISSEDGDERIDFQTIRRQVAAEFDLSDDWD